MGWGFDDIWNGLKQIPNAIGNAWGDYTGTTASNLSAQASEKNTQKQLAWERERATSAHQWEIEDLEKAGLNPVLSAGGSGAVTGGISPQLPDYSKYKGTGGALMEIGQILASQQNTAKQLNMNYEKILSDIELNETLGTKNKSDALNALSNAKKADQDTITSLKTSLKLDAEKDLVKEQTHQLKMMRAEIDEKLKQARANTLLLYEKIKNAPNEAEKLKYEKELKKSQAELFEVTKIAGTIGTTIAGAGGLVLGALKYKKVYQLGKKALKILNNIP